MPNYSFTYNQEIGHQGQSLVPHCPGGKSGVTIGPGYDLGHRNPQGIYNDLTNAGIDPETAYLLIDAAHKTGQEADNWIANRGGIIITEEQQQALFENVLVPEYEERTKKQLLNFAANNDELSNENIEWDNLSDKQKEILFDYVYNTGSLSRFPELTAAVLQEDWETAALHYERFSDDQPLAYRNEMFYREFLDPDFTEKPEETDIQSDEKAVFTDEFLTGNIEDLYFDDQDDTNVKDADDWYDEHS